MNERPHTISTAYEKGHQRPALSVYTFQPLEHSAGQSCSSSSSDKFDRTNNSTPTGKTRPLVVSAYPQIPTLFISNRIAGIRNAETMSRTEMQRKRKQPGESGHDGRPAAVASTLLVPGAARSAGGQNQGESQQEKLFSFTTGQEQPTTTTTWDDRIRLARLSPGGARYE